MTVPEQLRSELWNHGVLSTLYQTELISYLLHHNTATLPDGAKVWSDDKGHLHNA